MASASEGASAKQNIAAALAGGIDTLSLDQEIVFTQFVRLVLPLDGFVFWVKSDLLTPSALFNAFQLNTAEFNYSDVLPIPPSTLTIKGSLHYSTIVNQAEDTTEAVNTVIFTAEEPVQMFNDLQPNILWIGTYGGDKEDFDGPITFAFSSRGRYYEAADLFHYVGTAVLPAFEAQLITRTDQLSSQSLYVSNSLPIWLSLSEYIPPYDNGISCSLPLYPSFLVPDNLQPAYGAVHIEPGETEALQSAPFFDKTLGQYSLARDRVRITLYGLTNDAALMFLAAVCQFSYDYNTIGMMNMPVIKDDKRIAAELGVLAQKKHIDFEVSYNQKSVRDIARAQLQKIIINYLPQSPTIAPPSAYSPSWLATLPYTDPSLTGGGGGLLWSPGGDFVYITPNNPWADPNAMQWVLDLPDNAPLIGGMLWNNGGTLAISEYGYNPMTPIWVAQLPVNLQPLSYRKLWNNGLQVAVTN